MNFYLSENELIELGVLPEDVKKLKSNNNKVSFGHVSRNDLINEISKYFIYEDGNYDDGLAEGLMQQLEKENIIILDGDELALVASREIEYRFVDSQSDEVDALLKKQTELFNFIKAMKGEGVSDGR
ncbi:MAG: hypothetical protein ACRCX2_17090 [Paraclostridium sp.]